MVHVYLNYPSTHATLHGDPSCGHIPNPPNVGQRRIRLTLDTLSGELVPFVNQEYRFAAEAGLNDMWLDIDLGDATFERAVAEYIIRVLAQRYSPFGRIELKEHC